MLEENEFPTKARRVQNYMKTQQKSNLINKNEALVEIEEADEPSIHAPPKE